MTQTPSAAQSLQLPEVLDLTFAGPLAESFLALRGSKLAVDAAQVQRVGAQCVQVIMSAVSTWKADEVALSVVDPSPEFCDALSLLGIGLAEISTEEAPQ
jgi:chemotaxis protein CheX